MSQRSHKRMTSTPRSPLKRGDPGWAVHVRRPENNKIRLCRDRNLDVKSGSRRGTRENVACFAIRKSRQAPVPPLRSVR